MLTTLNIRFFAHSFVIVVQCSTSQIRLPIQQSVDLTKKLFCIPKRFLYSLSLSPGFCAKNHQVTLEVCFWLNHLNKINKAIEYKMLTNMQILSTKRPNTFCLPYFISFVLVVVVLVGVFFPAIQCSSFFNLSLYCSVSLLTMFFRTFFSRFNSCT